MTVEYNVRKIDAMLRDFYNATGIDMDLLKTDFTPAISHRPRNNVYCGAIQSTAAGFLACQASDAQLLHRCAVTGQAQTHICHAGLVDVAIPIVYDDSILGYIIFGRMRPDRDFSALADYIRGLGLPVQQAEDAYRQIPVFDEAKIRSLSNIATLMVKYILLEDMLTPRATGSIENAVAYIHSNLHRELSVQEICRGGSISKTMLYDGFHKKYGCTVSSYINARRVERSMELLRKTDMSMEEISQQVGFSSGSYYSKTFKRQTGLSPLQFRKGKT
jgi:AraC-like DNA-binding protein